MAERKFLYMDASEGFSTESDPTTDSITLAGLTSSQDITLTGGSEVVGLPGTPSGDTAATSKAYVDNLVSGLVWKDPVATVNLIDDSLSTPPGSPADGDAYIVGATPTGDWSGFSQGDLVEYNGSWQLVQAGGTAEPADGLRVLITSASAAGSFTGHESDIAVYDATGDTWNFTDPVDGWAVLCNGENSYWENTGWVYDTSAWVQFSGAGQITAGAGLTKSGNTINVGNGDGIQINADSIELDISAVNPGLTLEGSSPDKTLAVLLKASAGIEKDANGLYIAIDDTPDTLDVDADGLKVVGLPSLFKINGVAVSANVTAANLNTLTAGSSSNADSLHTHTVTAVDEAKRVEDTHLNNVSVSAGDVVRWSGVNNEVTQADNSTAAGSRVIGVARTGGASNPGTSEVVKHGVVPGALSGATVNTPYYLGASGALVLFASIPVPGRVIRVGFAKNATDLDVTIHDYGYKRA